jgi:predicted TPR repeat methyltransferase
MADDDGWLVSGSSDPDDVRRYYDEWAERYDETLGEWGYDAPGHIAGLVRRSVPDAAEVLDAGCGTGLAGLALRAAGYTGHLLGADLSPASIERARTGGAYDDVGAIDLQRPLPYDDDRFDAVMCVGVLTYVPDVAAIWDEFCRVTRPGGVVACTQRDDIWEQRSCDDVLHALEREGRWTVIHLSPSSSYLPANADFADEIGVRYLVATVRG